MVLEVGVETCVAVLPGAAQAALGVAHRLQDEARAGTRGIDVVLAAEGGARVGERGDHQRVPRADPLVVDTGPDPAIAPGIERRAGVAERRAGDLKVAAEKLGQTPPSNRQLLALRFMGLIAPPPGASLWLRARGILLIILIVIALLALGW